MRLRRREKEEESSAQGDKIARAEPEVEEDVGWQIVVPFLCAGVGEISLFMPLLFGPFTHKTLKA